MLFGLQKLEQLCCQINFAYPLSSFLQLGKAHLLADLPHKITRVLSITGINVFYMF